MVGPISSVGRLRSAVGVTVLALLLQAAGALPGNGTAAHAAGTSFVTEYPTATDGAGPREITAGADGNVWFTEAGASKIGRITPGGVVTEFPTPTQDSRPWGITKGADGNVWFAEYNSSKIGRISPAGVVTEFDTLTPGGQPIGITGGPDGNVWFAENSAGKIGRITPAGAVTEYDVAGTGPVGISSGPDGNVWFTLDWVVKVGKIDPSTGTVTTYNIPTQGSSPRGITGGPDGNVWFVEQGASKVAKVTPDGQVTEFPVRANASPYGITLAAGNLWFGENGTNRVGRITPDGTVMDFELPSGSAQGVTRGPDGNVWVAEEGASKIAVVLPNPPFPVVGGVRPTFGSPVGGTAVTISGLSFTGATAVAFGSHAAPSFTVDSDNQITAVAPAGEGTVDVTVTTPSGTSNPSSVDRYTYSSFQEYPVPGPPREVAEGPDGNLWFTEPSASSIGRMTPAGTVTEFPTPTPGASPWAITKGPDGNVWFSERVGKIGKITPTGTITELTPPGGSSQILGIATGPDGNIWYTVLAGRIGKVTPSGTFSEFKVADPDVQPMSIAAGPDGNLWFGSYGAGGIGRVTPSGDITTLAVPTPGGQWDITAGRDGNVWFVETQSNRIGRVTSDGTVTEFPLPAGVGYPIGIAVGPDSNVWFTLLAGNSIGKMTPEGLFSQFPIPVSDAYPVGIRVGPGGKLWFAQQQASMIGSLPTDALGSTPVQLSASTPVIVNRVDPWSGSSAGGTSVKISGVNFVGATAVQFGSAPATSFTVDNGGQITAVSPPGDGTVDVTVTTPNGTSTPSDGSKFSYGPPDCGMVVTKGTKLTRDIGPCPSDGIVVAADNVTLDLGGHKVFGTPGPSRFGTAAGVHVVGRHGVTVRNGQISDFDGGVLLDGGSGNTVTGLNVHDNQGRVDADNLQLGDGIALFHSARNRIAGNTVANNGVFDGIGVFGVDSNYNTIQGNTVTGNHDPTDWNSSEGIIVNPFLEIGNPRRGESLKSNNILNNVVRNNGGPGISNVSNTYAKIVGNTVTGNGISSGWGNGIGLSRGSEADEETHVLVQSNRITGNGSNGVEIYDTGANTVKNNVVTNNNVLGCTWACGIPEWMYFDLHDHSYDPDGKCLTNVWTDNTWGTGFYFPDCTANNGHGPVRPAGLVPTTADGTSPAAAPDAAAAAAAEHQPRDPSHTSRSEFRKPPPGH